MIKQITCGEFAKKIKFFFKGQLDAIQEVRIIQHRETCSKCNKLRHCLNNSTRTEYAKDEMTAEEREMVRDHIKNCSYCRGLVHAEIRFWEGEKFLLRRKKRCL